MDYEQYRAEMRIARLEEADLRYERSVRAIRSVKREREFKSEMNLLLKGVLQ